MITLEMAIALLAAGIAPKHTKLTYYPLPDILHLVKGDSINRK